MQVLWDRLHMTELWDEWVLISVGPNIPGGRTSSVLELACPSQPAPIVHLLGLGCNKT